MKDEEIDWLIYHRITGRDGLTTGELAELTSLTEQIVAASLERLKRNLLIESRDGTVHALSINESLIRCQAKYDRTFPITIENGVIKERKREGS